MYPDSSNSTWVRSTTALMNLLSVASFHVYTAGSPTCSAIHLLFWSVTMLVIDAFIMQLDRSRNQDLSCYESDVELAVDIRQVQEQNLMQALKDFLTVYSPDFQLKLKLSCGGIHKWMFLRPEKTFPSKCYFSSRFLVVIRLLDFAEFKIYFEEVNYVTHNLSLLFLHVTPSCPLGWNLLVL